jgi:hypothetical protein
MELVGLHFFLKKSQSLVIILSLMNPVNTISLKSILILSTHLHLGLPSRLFPSGFPTNILYAFLFSYILARRPTHLILLQAYVFKAYIISLNRLRNGKQCVFFEVGAGFFK